MPGDQGAETPWGRGAADGGHRGAAGAAEGVAAPGRAAVGELWGLPGWVYVVEAGPGDPGLLTVRGSELLRAAEVVVADAGLEAALQRWASPTAALWLVTPPAGAEAAPGRPPWAGRLPVAGRLEPDRVAGRLARWARAGLRVVRLVRGRSCRDEGTALAAAGVGVIPVPGVPTGGGSADGRQPAPPLAGWRVAVTRAAEQAGDLAELVGRLGGEALELPLIAVEPAPGEAELDAELDDPGGSWWVFTSQNGVAALARRLRARGGDARALAGARVAVVGEATRGALEGAVGIRADLVPSAFTGARLWKELARRVQPGQRVVWPRGDRAAVAAARPVVEAGAVLRAPVVYRTVLRRQEAAALLELVRAGRVDAVTLASPSACEALAEAAGPEGLGRFFPHREPAGPGGRRPLVVCIGPRTAQRAAALGLPVDRVPSRFTAEGLVAALLEGLEAGGGS
ncbi:uroporphyrinogen-III synthase [Thermaerobacter composti]|uniref:Uroporphyrinogen-III synthase n=1 Tax=Thermaerobacter composti TaxID=554949 RepID=A0ABZ0QML2_9FIRM|nr:uroporphyrinogen-III synthase [Thermaerobacter composti]WPD18032.1 uroporphyrinogen-III synthase [Thermaerobacter composti]